MEEGEIIEGEEALAAATEDAQDEPVRLSLDDVIARMKTGLTEKRTRPMRDAPDGYRYIVGPHLGLNHDQRRRARLAQERRWRNYMSWRRQLERVGIDPDEVLRKRQERKREEAERARLAARSDRLAGGDDAGEGEVPRLDTPAESKAS